MENRMAGFWNQSNTQIHDANGKPFINARAYFYKGGTSTPITVYKTYSLGSINAHPNPVVTNGNGYFPPVFFDEADGFYRERLTTAQGVVIYDVDGIPIIGPSAGGGGGGDNPVDPNSVLITGDMIAGYREGQRNGFVRANGRTIGAAISGASERANSDTQPLFEFLWNTDTTLAVVGGRGISSLADWTANKQMTLPDWRSRALIGTDIMGNIAAGIITGAVLGFGTGETAHTLTAAEMPNHAHPLSDPGHDHSWGNRAQPFAITPGNFGSYAQGGPDPSALRTYSSFTGITMSAVGGGQSHNNVQPSRALTIYIRL
jgi:microcystin-dependent protein